MIEVSAQSARAELTMNTQKTKILTKETEQGEIAVGGKNIKLVNESIPWTKTDLQKLH